MRLNAWAARLLRFVVRLVQRLTGGDATHAEAVQRPPLATNEAADSGAPRHWLERVRSSGPPAHWLERIRQAREAGGAMQTFDQMMPLPAERGTVFLPPAEPAPDVSSMVRPTLAEHPAQSSPRLNVSPSNHAGVQQDAPAIRRPEQASGGETTTPMGKQPQTDVSLTQHDTSNQPKAVPLSVQADAAIAGLRATMRALRAVPDHSERTGNPARLPTGEPANTATTNTQPSSTGANRRGNSLRLPIRAETTRRSQNQEPREPVNPSQTSATQIITDSAPQRRSDHVRITRMQNVPRAEPVRQPSLPDEVAGDETRTTTAYQQIEPLSGARGVRSPLDRPNVNLLGATPNPQSVEAGLTHIHSDWPESEMSGSQPAPLRLVEKISAREPTWNASSRPDAVEFVSRWPDLPEHETPKPYDGLARSQREQQRLQRLAEEQQRL